MAVSSADTRGREMSDQDERAPGQPERRVPAGYEPPRLERVLTPADLEREILYAGDETADTDGEL
jgi:hypothetical protein